MRRRSIQSCGAALALILTSLLFAGAASAAPTLGVELTRSPSTIARNDQFASYEVKVKNTSPSDPTFGTLTVAMAMPSGTVLNAASGTGWTCALATASCTSTAAIAPGASYPVLKLSEVWLLAGAPPTVTVAASASGGGAVSGASDEDGFTFGPVTPFGLATLSAKALDEEGDPEVQAGAHPNSATAILTLQTRTRPDGIHVPVDDLQGGVAEIPAGVIGNPAAVEAFCPVNRMKEEKCPKASEAGGVFLELTGPDRDKGVFDQNASVYRLPREKGYPATFGFKTVGPAFVIRTKVRTDGDYGITAVLPLAPSEPPLFESYFTFCAYGLKKFVNNPDSPGSSETDHAKPVCYKRSDPGAHPKPFTTNPTTCPGTPLRTKFAVESWKNPGRRGSSGLPDLSDPNWSSREATTPAITGCERLTEEWTSNHEPSFLFQPDNHVADSPAAYTADLHIPQEGLIDPDGLATSHLKDVKVVLPEGVGFNPGVGDGLAACSEQQVGFLGSDFPAPSAIRFDTKMPECPPNSKIGLGTVKTPLLEETLHGSIYLAAQRANPFGSEYAIYLAVEEPDVGVVSKVAGKVTVDPRTAQITTTFAESPQLPFEDLELHFFGGPRSALANPVTCGIFTTNTELTPWSAADPYNPQPEEIARPFDQVQIGSGPNGSPCVSSAARRPFDVGYSAGSKDPIAGAKSPFQMRITRPDGSQELDKLEISPPPGFVGSLKGIPYCSEAQIQAAKANSGKAEEKNPSCPPASQLGTTNSGAGAGSDPYYAPGKIYLAGPYKGQTLSAIAITPAVAGPFDLGNVVIRSALKLDPVTARITAVTDPLPPLVRGIPLRIRDVRINLDRPGWGQTPTNCETLSSDLVAYGSSGAIAKRSARYQLGGCEKLGFKPKLSIHLKGGTKRGDHPALVAVLSTRPGDANIARAAVTLPPSAFLDQSHIRTICTRVQFAANACPTGAIYGYGKAVTDLLDDPIEGNVYLRSSDNKLPDLIAALKGVANIEAVGRIDSVHGGIRNTFDVIPDAPFEAFTLRMQGGNKGLVVNSQNLCAKDHLATVKLTAQNGRHYNFRPKVIADGCAKGKKAKGKRQHRRHRG